MYTYVIKRLIFSEAKEYSARYLAQLAAKAGDRRSWVFLERRYLKRGFRPSAIKPIDIVLRRSVVSGFSSPVCLGFPNLLKGKMQYED
jgi:hypothetical protein